MPTPVKRPGTPYYIVRPTINGKRFERSTGETTLAKAKAAVPRIIAELLAEQGSELERPSDWREMTFAAAMTAYVGNGGEDRFLDPILEHFQETRLGRIDNTAMSEAMLSLYPEAAPATIRRQLYVPVNAIINFVKDDKLRAPKGGGTRTVFFTPEQVKKMMELFGTKRRKHLLPLVTFLIGQGARTGEAFNLDGRDVNLEARYAILRDTKNGDERTVELIPRVIAALSTLDTIGKPGPVFRRRMGRFFKEKSGRGGQIRNPFRNVVEDMGLDPLVYTPHVCRHTWATWHYAVRQDPLALKREGGWKSNEYQRYVKAAPPGLRDSILAHDWDFMGENWGNRGFGAARVVQNQ